MPNIANEQYNSEKKIGIIDIIAFFIILQPLIDIFTAFMVKNNYSVTVGIVTKATFLIIVVGYLIFYSASKYRGIAYNYFSFLILYCFLFTINNFALKPPVIALNEVVYLFKVFYFPVFLVALFALLDKSKDELTIKKVIAPIYVYTFIVLISIITQTGFSSYGGFKGGTSGWFYSPNEIGAIFAMFFPILFFKYIESKKTLLNSISLIIIMYVMLSLGTKVPFLSVIITISFFVIKYLITLIRTGIKTYAFYYLIFVIVGLIVILPLTPATDNLKLHLENLEINSPLELIKPSNIAKTTNFIFSGRNNYVLEKSSYYKESTLSRKILGNGNYEKSGSQYYNITTEMDFFDIFFNYGIGGFILYFLPMLYFSKKYLVKFKDKTKTKNILRSSFFLSIFIGFLVSALAGHVLTSPSPSIYLAVIISYYAHNFYLKEQKNEKNMD